VGGGYAAGLPHTHTHAHTHAHTHTHTQAGGTGGAGAVGGGYAAGLPPVYDLVSVSHHRLVGSVRGVPAARTDSLTHSLAHSLTRSLARSPDPTPPILPAAPSRAGTTPRPAAAHPTRAPGTRSTTRACTPREGRRRARRAQRTCSCSGFRPRPRDRPC
jgi:hypothetical protein